MEKRFEILATFPGGDDEKGCGYQMAHNALDAVVREISGKMIGTEDAKSISAGDYDLNATAFRCGDTWEVHAYINDEDVFFTLPVAR